MEVKEETQEERKEREKKEYMKAWREANKDKVAKNGKKYYESNKEKILEIEKEKFFYFILVIYCAPPLKKGRRS